MIKATGVTETGVPVFFIGLSGENIARLYAKEPILINTEEFGLPKMYIIVLASKTEEEIVEDIVKSGVMKRNDSSS